MTTHYARARVGLFNEDPVAIASQLLDGKVEGELTLRQALRVLAAVAAGKTTKAGGAVQFRDLNDTADRVSATLTGGQRTNVTLTPE